MPPRQPALHEREPTVCEPSTSGAIDDAAHLLFECNGAALPHVRTRFGALLASIPAHSDAAAQLQFISNTENQASMAFFISDCMRAAQPWTPLPAIGPPTPIDASASEEVL